MDQEVLLQDSLACVRNAQALRVRLGDFLTGLPGNTDLDPTALKEGPAEAAVLADVILSGAAAQKVVDVARWLGRLGYFVQWVRGYEQLVDSKPTLPSTHPPLSVTPMEYETAFAEDEMMAGEIEIEPSPKVRATSPLVGVNLYLYMEDYLMKAAEQLVGMPSISAAIAAGLIACRALNMGLYEAVAEHRDTAIQLTAERVAEEPLCLAFSRNLEVAAAQVLQAAHKLLRSINRSVALMQMALDNGEACAECWALTAGMDVASSCDGDGESETEGDDDEDGEDAEQQPQRGPSRRHLIRIVTAEVSSDAGLEGRSTFGVYNGGIGAGVGASRVPLLPPGNLHEGG